MKRKNMKAFNLSVWMTLILTFLGTNEVYGGSGGNYAELKAAVAPNGTGKVYVVNGAATTDDPNGYKTEAAAFSEEGKNQYRILTAFAKPNRGQKFTNWS